MDLGVNAVVNTGCAQVGSIESAVTHNIQAAETVLLVELQSDVIGHIVHSKNVALCVNLAALGVSVHRPRAMHREKVGNWMVLPTVVLTTVAVQVEPLN